MNCDGARVSFHPYYRVKDLLGFFIFFSLFGAVVLLFPDLFMEPENFIPANPLVTPNHIQPEWYFLWLYAILRAIPNKLGGVVALFGGILCLAFLPFLINLSGLSCGGGYSLVRQIFFWSIVTDFLILT